MQARQLTSVAEPGCWLGCILHVHLLEYAGRSTDVVAVDSVADFDVAAVVVVGDGYCGIRHTPD
jgi:hypothetical protein